MIEIAALKGLTKPGLPDASDETLFPNEGALDPGMIRSQAAPA
jgi:hypothetical protein